MELTIDTNWILAGLLAATRWAGILLLTPVLGFATLPASIRVLFIVMLSLMTLVSAAPSTIASLQAATLPDLSVLLLRELVLGAALGFGIQCAFGTFAVGGRLLDYQMGLSVASLFDPTTRAMNSLMGTLLAMLGATLMLTLDAHHGLLRAVMQMFTLVPVGAPVDYRPGELIAQFSIMLGYGFVLVAPAIAGLMIVDVAIALASRLMPQANVYFVSIPVKVFVGLLLLTLSLHFIEPGIAALYESLFERWQFLVWVH